MEETEGRDRERDSSSSHSRLKLKIGYLTTGDAQSALTWSGTPYFIANSLQANVGDIEFLGPLRSKWSPVLRALGFAVRGLTGHRILPNHSSKLAAELSRKAFAALSQHPVDLLFVTAGSTLLAELPETDVPIVYSSDTTIRLICDYYPRYSRILKFSRRQAELIEYAAISRADLLLYPTRWAAQSAIDDYGADPGKVYVVPYGANLTDPPPSSERRSRSADNSCRLLFVGVDWKVKGGQIAVETLQHLRRNGIDAELVICGCTPPANIDMDGLTVIPFLNKHNSDDRKRLEKLYRQADFFLLPTRNECYGIVFCEAAAYGVPSIATRTGGVPDVVQEGVNGHLLPASASGSEYANLIAGILADGDRYSALRLSSRRVFEQQLNWRVWGRETAVLISQLMDASGKHPSEPLRAF